MINKIKRFFYNVIYSLPFGMKAANDEMFSQKTSINTDNVGVHQVIQENNIGKDLLKGEVTQQVEELRYRTYKVERESNKYEYLGDGVAVKKDKKVFDINTIHFKQNNQYLYKSIYDELNRVDVKQYGVDEYTLSIVYDSQPKFKLEKYCTLFEFDKDTFKMHFEKLPNKNDITSYGFIKEIDYITKNINRTTDYTDLKIVRFVTYKTDNEDDFIEYNCHELLLTQIIETDKEYIFEYDINWFERNDLTEKFYSKTMDDKYKNKEKKELVLDMTNSERIRYCSVCSKEMSTYDGDITEETYGYPICKECLEKTLLLN